MKNKVMKQVRGCQYLFFINEYSYVTINMGVTSLTNHLSGTEQIETSFHLSDCCHLDVPSEETQTGKPYAKHTINQSHLAHYIRWMVY